MAAAVHMEGVGDAAIKFMKASHQKTLFELRAEIALLRQKNADLTMSAALSETIAEGTCKHPLLQPRLFFAAAAVGETERGRSLFFSCLAFVL